MEFINKKEFLDLIKYNVEDLGLKKNIIIENASNKVIKNINLKLRDTFAVVCGTETSGACGLAIARNLKVEGKFVEVYIVDTNKEASESFKEQLNIIKNYDIKLNKLETIEDLENFPKNLKRVNTIIDSITGIDYNHSFSGSVEYVMDSINKSRIYIISVDIPSGIDYDTGHRKSVYINPNLVVTFYKNKKSLLNVSGLERYEVIIENIGLMEIKNVRYKTY